MSKSISTLAAGSLVRDVNTKYSGSPIIWKIAEHNHTGYPSGSTTLITEKCITTHCFDGIEASNSDSNRRQYGNNRYKFSNIRQWLNKAGANWYEAQHEADAPPTNANNYSQKPFGYDTENGFLSNLSTDFLNNLLDTELSVVMASVDGGGSETVTDKIFLASVNEVGLGSGGAFPIFTDNNSRKGYMTAECLAWYNAGGYTATINDARYWWLRDAYASHAYSARYVHTDGALNYNLAYFGHYGVRPLCNIQSSILVTDEPDENGVYDIIFAVDTAPHISGADENKGNIYGGFNYQYSVTDNSQSDTVTAVEKIDGNVIRTYTVTLGSVNSFALSTAAWRALTYGSHTATITVTDTEEQSETRTITFTKHQAAPTISGSDASLGEIVTELSYNYTVNDLNGVDGDIVTVVENLDGVVKKTYQPTLGAQNIFAIDQENWLAVAFGNHTLVITATDSYGQSATRTITFVKRNYAPAISGSDTDLGIKNAAFDYNYTIYDQNFGQGDKVTVTEKVDGVQKRSYELEEQTNAAVNIPVDTFICMENAQHTIEVEATDSEEETVTRTVTFTKNQNISLTLAEPVVNEGDQEAMPVEAIINLDAYVPTGASINVQICNNGFDATPTYEDCTVEAVNGQTYTFVNDSKTAERWGVNIKITINKGTATETPYLASVNVRFKY